MARANLSDFAGRVFGRLTAVKLSHRDEHGRECWEFLCSCGNTKLIKKAHVAQGESNSCGCLQKELASKSHTTHGRSRIGDKTYGSWHALLTRVRHQPTASYIGATVSEEWKSFENFLRDMGERPEGKTIDRIDNEKGYCKDNCRWATKAEQSRNVRKCFTRKTSSKYKGVKFVKKYSLWNSTIRTGEKRIYLGQFKTETAAALAYNEAAKKYHGEFACLNIVA